MVLQRYALRFTISDATLDSLKLPRSTSKSKPDPSQVDQEHKPTPSSNDPETSDPLHTSDTAITADQKHRPDGVETAAQQGSLDTLSSSPPTLNSPAAAVTHSQHVPPQPQELHKPQTQHTESPTTHQQPTEVEPRPQAKHAPPQIARVSPQPTQPVHTHPPPPSRPVPLLAAKPYCQPRNTHAVYKSVKVRGSTSMQETYLLQSKKNSTISRNTDSLCVGSSQMDRTVRINGEKTEGTPVPATPTSPLLSPLGVKEEPSESAPSQQTVEQPPPPQTEKVTSSGSAISSLIGGRNCVIKTTIVTELTQTHVEPHPSGALSNGQVTLQTTRRRRTDAALKALTRWCIQVHT